jgi:hypothetical protein
MPFRFRRPEIVENGQTRFVVSEADGASGGKQELSSAPWKAAGKCYGQQTDLCVPALERLLTGTRECYEKSTVS